MTTPRFHPEPTVGRELRNPAFPGLPSDATFGGWGPRL